MEIITEIIEREDGRMGLGNTIEVTRDEALALIKDGKARAEGYAIGEIPSEWLEGGKVSLKKEIKNKLEAGVSDE